MGTNTSKPSAYASSTPRRSSAHTGGVQPAIRYIHVTMGGDGVSRMGGIHQTSQQKRRTPIAQSNYRPNTGVIRHTATVNEPVGQQRERGSIEGVNAVDQPPPPYSR